MSDYHSESDASELPLFGGTVEKHAHEPIRDVPRSRDSDPSTSHEGAEYAEGALSENQFRMLLAFQIDRTANEAAQACVGRFGGSQETYRKRKGEIENRLRNTGKRRCSVTKRPAETFVVIAGAVDQALRERREVKK